MKNNFDLEPGPEEDLFQKSLHGASDMMNGFLRMKNPGYFVIYCSFILALLYLVAGIYALGVTVRAILDAVAGEAWLFFGVLMLLVPISSIFLIAGIKMFVHSLKALGKKNTKAKLVIFVLLMIPYVVVILMANYFVGLLSEILGR